jgi:predicted PurR-regulated permease PerM
MEGEAETTDAARTRQRPPLNETAAWHVASRSILLVFGLVFLVWLLVQLKAVVIQTLLAVILAAGMTPIVNRLTVPRLLGIGRRTWTPPRALVVLVLYLLLVLIVNSIGALVIPPAAGDIEDLVRGLPSYGRDLQSWLTDLPTRYPFLPVIDVSQSVSSLIQSGTSALSTFLSQALIVVQVALGVLSGALNGIFILVLALYITVDSGRIQRYLVSWLPADRQEQADRVTERIGERLGGWLRGQILLSGIIGGITLVGLLVLDIKYAVLLALVAAIGEAVPMIGPIFSAIPAVIVAFFDSPLKGVLAIGLYILVQQLENNLVVPKVMERAVALHPLVVMLALLSGGELLGITGAVLSVPTAAAIAVVFEEVRSEWMDRRRLEPSVAGDDLLTTPKPPEDGHEPAPPQD